MPFGSDDPDPESDVVVLFSLEVQRLVCLRCDLSHRRTVEASTAADMSQHLDAHRAAGYRVPNTYYEALVRWREAGGDRTIRAIYAWPGRDQDGGLFVVLSLPGNPLGCLQCKLNQGRTVSLYCTADLLEHLNDHHNMGYVVPSHVLEALGRDRDEIDEGVRSWLEERGVKNLPAPQWQAANFWDPFAPVPERPEAFDRLAAMVPTAIACLEEPLSPAERSIGWDETFTEAAVDGLRLLLVDLERVRRGDVADRKLVSDIFSVTDGIGSAIGFYARCDPKLHVCDEIKSFIIRLAHGDPFREQS